MGEQRKHVRPVIYRVFTENPGKRITIERLMRETKANKSVVQTAVGALRRADQEFGARLETVLRGHIWKFNPPTTESEEDTQQQTVADYAATKAEDYIENERPHLPPANRTFIAVGTFADGSLLLKDIHEDALYRAVRI